MPDPRYRQADREALITLGLYAFFFVWWFVFAFGLGSGDPADFTYVCGFPAWFFYSCVLGYPVICVVLWYVVRRYFRLMPLDDDSGEDFAVRGDGDAQSSEQEKAHNAAAGTSGLPSGRTLKSQSPNDCTDGCASADTLNGTNDRKDGR